MKIKIIAAALCLFSLSCGHLAHASGTLRIGTNADITALDPHFQFVDTNVNITRQIYESLFNTGAQKELLPGLALSGNASPFDPSVWEISLRTDATFDRGQKFTKADVLCTLQRIQSYAAHSPAGYSSNLKAIDLPRTLQINASSADPYLLKVATVRPFRFLRENLAALVIMSCEDANLAMQIDHNDQNAIGKPASQEVLNAFASGRLLNGTGPFRFKRWVPVSQSAASAMVELERVREERSPWAIVRYQPVPDAGARVRQLMTGELDVVASVPQDKAVDLSHSGFPVISAPGLRVIHMQLHSGSDGRENDPKSVPVRNEAGKAFPNPLKSFHFRQALAYAVNKDRLVNIMGGQAMATDQYMLPGRVGFLPERRGQIFELHTARAYLARAAAEPNLGFLATEKLVFTIHGPNDRYPNDRLILEELAKMWTEAFPSIRFVTAPEPMRSYLGNAKKYLVTLLGGGVDNGHAEGALRLYFMPGSGLNLANYSHQGVMERYHAGVSSVNESVSDSLLTEALRIALEDRAMIPLFNLHEVWGTRQGICYEPRSDGLTLATGISRCR